MGDDRDPFRSTILRGSARSYSPPSSRSIVPGANSGTFSARSCGPAQIVAAYDIPPPMAQTLESENMPSAEKVARVAKAMLGG